MLTTTDDLVDDYKKFLANKHPGRIKSFCDLLASHPASARAEAITFYFLRDRVDKVQIEEDPTKGGVDFRCETRKSEFVVEVTHLENESVSQASGKRNEIPEKNTVGSYSRITHLLRSNASDKARQMSGYCCPSLLVMTSEHVYANDLLSSKIAAEFLLTSDTSIPVPHPPANPATDLILETDLKDSVFFRFNNQNNNFESCRQSISAILLCSIYANAMGVIGILHPNPVRKFPIKFLPTIPFVKLKKWPPENNEIGTEWVTHKRTNTMITGAFRWDYSSA
ncbi:MAG: hypothetical protein OXU36_08095 [Candidatus Poribacteria bacterium]|nr:hypothetical protein [Candidatus Poribacteria bacterium]